MELSMSMFATPADYWKARAEQAEQTVAEVAAELKCDPDNEQMLNAVHNLNWALGTTGYEQMATAEERADHEGAMERVNAMLARMEQRKREHDAMEKDAERYRWLRDNPWPPILEADIVLHRNARWDESIDAAMATAQTQQDGR